MARLHRWVTEQRHRGRAYQPRFRPVHLSLAWLGALVALALVGLLSTWSGMALLAAPRLSDLAP